MYLLLNAALSGAWPKLCCRCQYQVQVHACQLRVALDHILISLLMSNITQ